MHDIIITTLKPKDNKYLLKYGLSENNIFELLGFLTIKTNKTKIINNIRFTKDIKGGL